MRRDAGWLVVILVVALFVRIYPAWHGVFDGTSINFLETDAWYHVRLIENQVRNWPWRVTLDPYAAPGGQFVPIAPFFDTLTSTVVIALRGRAPDTATIERIAAFVPPALGALTIVAVWALARRAFDRVAALVAAALLAILPGHFLDRTMLGFYDHHALEACLVMATLWAVAITSPIGCGLLLGLYLLTWSSGALVVAVLGIWLLAVALRARASMLATARFMLGAVLIAFVMVLAFQDPGMYRYRSQVIGMAGLIVIAAAMRLSAERRAGRPRTVTLALATALVGAVSLLAFSATALPQILNDIARLKPDPARMAVLEARPLFLYPGTWNWLQPWNFFRTGFYIGVAGLIAFAAHVWRKRQPIDLLIWLFTAAMFVATIGQNRFGYYLMPGCALLGGWMASRALAWRVEAGIALMIVMLLPNVSPTVLLSPHSGSFTPYWRNTVVWLRDHTPPPFDQTTGDRYYYARYPRDAVPPPDYSIMNWWDHGYWITQTARRVPVANPTQERAPASAAFYAATDEANAVALLIAERSRYVVSDWELPFRITREGTIMGRFQNVIDWAGGRHADYYEVVYRRESNAWGAVWVFKEPYYRSMAYHLSVLAGAAVVPVHATSVIVVADRVDTTGMRFGEIVAEHTYATYQQALEAAKVPSPNGRTLIVGLDPWRPAFPLPAITSLREVFESRTPDQQPGEAPWVRVFQRVP